MGVGMDCGDTWAADCWTLCCAKDSKEQRDLSALGSQRNSATTAIWPLCNVDRKLVVQARERGKNWTVGSYREDTRPVGISSFERDCRIKAKWPFSSEFMAALGPYPDSSGLLLCLAGSPTHSNGLITSLNCLFDLQHLDSSCMDVASPSIVPVRGQYL